MKRGKRVLVVDDDESIRDFLAMALTDDGYDVTTADEGQSALETARRWDPALILLDMRMGGMDGWSFARAYRKTSKRRAPILVVTAARDAAVYAAQIQADAFLAKPFELRDLLGLVARLSGAARPSPDSASSS
jgi:DNA-binding response OmpR family regulator